MIPAGVTWRLRSLLSADARRRVRELTDPLAGPLGSIRGARTSDPVVALTFDDGPDPSSTPGVLDALARSGAHATWFVLVDRAEAHPELVRRMLADGHDVGLHGADHRRLTRLDRRELRGHIAEAQRRLAAVTGEAPRWFRPPYGSQDLPSFVAARRCGMQVVVWSADCEDWVQRAEAEIAQRAVAGVRPGAVLLLHDALAADPDEPAPDPALDRPRIADLVLAGLAARGLRPVSVSELLHGRRVHRTAWFRP
jgi:peptidoglycan/xylan/chitin deacetylase (PgdA/CDA1 family)